MTDSKGFIETCRNYGNKRLEIPGKAKSLADWQAMWYDPIHPYSFKWGECWKGAIQYRVDDYAAEVGFWLDVIGLDCNVLSDDFAMINTPDKQFTFTITTATAAGTTPADAIAIEFMIADIAKTGLELTKRGISFEVPIHPDGEGSSLFTGTLRTPHGVAVNLWGVEELAHSPE